MSISQHPKAGRPCSSTPATLGAEGHRFETAGLALPLRSHQDWLKFKNPEAPAVKREAEEDWGR